MDEPSPAPDTSSRPEPVEGFAPHRDGRPIQAARLFFLPALKRIGSFAYIVPSTPSTSQTHQFYPLSVALDLVAYEYT